MQYENNETAAAAELPTNIKAKRSEQEISMSLRARLSLHSTERSMNAQNTNEWE